MAVETPKKYPSTDSIVETEETLALEGEAIIRNYLSLIENQKTETDSSSASWQNVWRNGDWSNFDKSSWGNNAR